MARMIYGRLGAVAALALCLGACQGKEGSYASLDGTGSASILLESLDGIPAPVKAAFLEELTTAALDRKVEIAGPDAQARYRIRGYLSTQTINGQRKIAYVWDIFDSQQRRAQRLTGSDPLPGQSPQPLSSLDRATLTQLASASMDDIAAFLAAPKAAVAPDGTEAPDSP